MVGRELCPFTSALPLLLQISAPRPGLAASHQPALPWSPPQDLLPETAFVWGRWRGTMEQGGRLPRHLRGGWSGGVIAGGTQGRAMSLSAWEHRDRLLTGEKGTWHLSASLAFLSTHPNTLHLTAPTPCTSPPLLVLEISQCWE